MFLNNDFLLTSSWAKELYWNYAEKNPIVDYHCHLNPKEIYEDKRFKNLTEAWLENDHYKWRLMRASGVSEEYITGNACDYDKFIAWARTIPHAIGNPIYVWTQLELKRFFDIDLLLNEENAPEIWKRANEKLNTDSFSRRNLIRNAKVKVICTTDDPVDDLHYHDLIASEVNDFYVYPTFRPDNGLNINNDSFLKWIHDLESTVGYGIHTYNDFLLALEERIEFFHQKNCRIADHGLEQLYYEDASDVEVSVIFSKVINGKKPSLEEVNKYFGKTLIKLFEMYSSRGWVSQLHLKATRNNNSIMLGKVGMDSGFDAMSDLPVIGSLQRLLDCANSYKILPKTILYSLDPSDYSPLVALIGCYQEDDIMKLQLGSGWWFNDTRNGMRKQLTELANGSLLGHFVGMVTDSRSFLSYTRHEYFRRVLCELIGEWISRGECPVDTELMGKFIDNISYNNAVKYFGFDKLNDII